MKNFKTITVQKYSFLKNIYCVSWDFSKYTGQF